MHHNSEKYLLQSVGRGIICATQGKLLNLLSSASAAEAGPLQNFSLIQGPMERARHSWREACALALKESDPTKLFGRIEQALTALERRYAECEYDPLTPAELKAIRKTIHTLERRLEEKLAAYSAVDPRQKKISRVPDDAIVRELAHARHLLYILRL